MNKQELIKAISTEAGLSHDEARLALVAISKLIKETLKAGQCVKISGFGKFSIKKRASRVATNPQTKEKIQIPESKVMSFKAGKELKDAILE